MRMPWLIRARDELVNAPLEAILHPSRWRLKCIGLLLMFGHPLFGWIWKVWLPQPFENLWLRMSLSILSLPFLFDMWSADISSKATRVLFSLNCFIQLPLMFSWMYFCNSGNTVWLASVSAMILIYYHITDWRLATLGTAFGGILGWVLFDLLGPATPPMTLEQVSVNAVIIAFAWFTAFALGFSSANLRRGQLQQTLNTIGIMAHELRTPLSTMSLVGDALRGESRTPDGGVVSERLDRLSQRLHVVVRNMNRQIDTQIANARLTRLPTHKETTSASQLVREAVFNYPYRSTRERECVNLRVHRDFFFRCSPALFAQVIDNLLKNAFKSLAAANSSLAPGDLTVEVGVLQMRGHIVVSDRGRGLDAAHRNRIFELFFSTDKGAGHGLGLPFCKRVVQTVGGFIRVASTPGQGATFTIVIPLSTRGSDE